ncbi:hypothetical protein [Bradyrhizobium sp. ORS 86]|uniref:hypothetical protein n=1 Tax=Bradyrhizobium sp. ORS 86 TaxID=1685970 RepID=UPI00388E195D
MFDLEQLQTRLQYMTAGARLRPLPRRVGFGFSGSYAASFGMEFTAAWFCKADRALPLQLGSSWVRHGSGYATAFLSPRPMTRK